MESKLCAISCTPLSHSLVKVDNSAIIPFLEIVTLYVSFLILVIPVGGKGGGELLCGGVVLLVIMSHVILFCDLSSF